LPVDPELLGSKLLKYREQFQASAAEIEAATGIPATRLRAFEEGSALPTGDEILIISDYYKCDYNYFLSGDQPAVFEQTEELYRVHGGEFSKEDRWAVQEFLFICDCEESLQNALEVPRRTGFAFRKWGSYFKAHGEDAAHALRRFLGYRPNEVPPDVFRDFRSIGLHMFRRRLGNSRISGLFIRHPTAGSCVLVNYDEDVYRQRFTAAHEAAHAILDDDQDFVVSYRGEHKLPEVRANTFASRYLLPPECVDLIPADVEWTPETVQEWAERLRVNAQPLAIALEEAGRISETTARTIAGVRIPLRAKTDPELPDSLSPRSLERVKQMLARGLSNSYVALCFDAHDAGVISAGRLAEILIADRGELTEIANLYGRSLTNAN
jgi:Zn-dependent peptidase ImmA (M78 family)/transcriptional regulator with XRE-family HTH domain